MSRKDGFAIFCAFLDKSYDSRRVVSRKSQSPNGRETGLIYFEIISSTAKNRLTYGSLSSFSCEKKYTVSCSCMFVYAIFVSVF